jgi:hypothetical protein
MKRIIIALGFLGLLGGIHAQTIQLPAGFTATASGAVTFPFGCNPVVPCPQTFLYFPSTIVTLGANITAVGTTTSWTAQLEQAPASTGPWTTCGSAITITASSTGSGTCAPSTSSYVELVITPGSGGGSLNGLVYGETASGGGGGVSAVSGVAPVASSGGTTPAISMHVADASDNGYLASADWSTFNGKQAALSLIKGTYTDGDLCTYTASGTLLNCNTTPGSGTTTNALTGAASGGASAGTTFNGSSAVTFDYHTLGAQVNLSLVKGTYTDGDWCSYTASGTLLNCNNAVPQVNLSLTKGTFTDGDYCTYTASGTVLNCNSAGGSMTWPAGGAGIPNYNGSNAWGTSYSASNLIPANFLPTGTSSTQGALLLGAAGGANVYLGFTPANCTAGTAASDCITNGMTTLGDLLYGGASGASTRLAGPTGAATTEYFLTDTTTGGSAAQAPAWVSTIPGASVSGAVASATTATNATNAATTTKSDNTAYYLGLWPANSSSNQGAIVVSATYNPSTGTLTFPAGSSLGTSDTGTPRLSFGTNLISSNVNVSAPALLSGTPSSGAQAALPSGAHGMACDQSSTAGVPASSVDYIRCGASGLVGSNNNGAESAIMLASSTYTGTISSSQVTTGLGYTPANCTAGTSGSDCLTLSSGLVPTGNIPGYVADVTFTVSSSTTINANSCSPASSSAGTSVSMTGLTSTMVLSVTPNADITNTTGWGNPAAGVLYITLAPGSGSFTYHVCNNTSSNITTGGSATFNAAAR